MAVTSVFTRQQLTEDLSTTQEFCSVALTGTYAPGGFTTNPFAISGGLGSSPVSGSSVLSAQYFSPLGYIYVSSVSGKVMTTKIFSAANTELGTVAVPDALLTCVITKRKI